MKLKQLAAAVNASKEDGVQYRNATLWEMILGTAGEGMTICFYLLVGFASYIGSEGYGIATAAIGIILTCSRVYDAVTDTLAAIIYEKMPAARGKIRVFVCIGWVIMVLGVLLLFDWGAGKYKGVSGVVVFILIYLFYLIGYTFANIGKGTVTVILTNNPKQRPMFSFVGLIYSYGVPVILNNFIAFFILPKYDNKYSVGMLGELCYWFVGVSIIFVILMFIGVHKKDVEASFVIRDKSEKKKQKVTMKEMWSVLKDNKDVQRYIVACASDKFALSVSSQSIIMNLMNGVLIGSYTASAMVSNFTTVIGLIFAFTGAVFVARVGAKKAMVRWSWVSIGLAGGMILFCCILGKDEMAQIGHMGSLPFIIYCLITLAITATKMILSTCAGTMRADVVDGEMARSGNFMPAIIGGVYSLIDKIISAFAYTMAAFAISFIGYTTTLPQLGDPVTNEVFVTAMVLCFGLPIIGWICNVLAMKNYTLDRKRMIEIQREIEEKKVQMKG